MINKKGISEQGNWFNLNRLSMLIIFLAAVGIGLIILVPRLSSEAAGGTTFNFGKYLWDILTGGVE